VLDKHVDDGKGGSRNVQIAESFGHVQNPYPREYLAFEPDRETLAEAARMTGGRSEPTVAQVFDPSGETVRYHEDLWPKLVLAAVLVYLADLFLRRVRLFDRGKPRLPFARSAR
jgi:Ca-activated chloride channel homolog